MSLSEDLLAQALHLATYDKGRPKQASLRRAVSSAYYAIFHLLSQEASTRLSPASPSTLAPRISRSLDHAEMGMVCRTVSGGSPTAVMQRLYPHAFSVELRLVARTFLMLQGARHEADYDTTVIKTRSETLSLIDATREAFLVWKQIRSSDEVTVFLAALFFAKRWDR